VTLRRIKEFAKAMTRTSWTSRADNWWRSGERKWSPCVTPRPQPIRPERLCKEISKALPPNGILVFGHWLAGIWTGAMVYLTNQARAISAPRALWAGDFQPSMGAKCGAPDRPVICFIGDGGFYYHLSELETASRCGIKTVTVVNNNQCLQQCLGGINRAYGDRPGNRDEQSKFQDINFAQVAQDMGVLESVSSVLKRLRLP